MNLEAKLRSNPVAFVADQVELGASNLDTLRAAKGESLLLPDQYVALTSAYLQGINSALRRCLPGDAYWNLRALAILAENIPVREGDLDTERARIIETIGFSGETTHITTKRAYQHFLPYARYNGSTLDPELYYTLTTQMTTYIAESVRRGVTQQDPNQLERVIPMMRLLAYMHKAVGLTYHYGCEDEFDVIASWGVNRETLAFVTLTKEQSLALGEVTSESMHSIE